MSGVILPNVKKGDRVDIAVHERRGLRARDELAEEAGFSCTQRHERNYPPRRPDFADVAGGFTRGVGVGALTFFSGEAAWPAVGL